jgi:hypothetical protein
VKRSCQSEFYKQHPMIDKVQSESRLGLCGPTT